MKAVVTRVTSASVTIEGTVRGRIENGFLVLLGVGPEDTEEVCDHLAEKVAHVRVFSDEAGKMNKSIDQVGGAFLVISQFSSMRISRSAARAFRMRRSRSLRSLFMSASWRICAPKASTSSTGSSGRRCRSLRSTMARSRCSLIRMKFDG